eukprot:2953078-Rhodomonas_salina.1
MGDSDRLRLAVLAVMPYALAVSQTAGDIRLSGTVYTLLVYAYCTSAIYCIYVASIGQSALWSVHARNTLFLCLYAHLGAIVVMHTHLLNPKCALLLTYVLVWQCQAYLLGSVQSVRFRCASANNLRLCLMLAAFLVMTWNQHVLHFEYAALLDMRTWHAVWGAEHS